MILILVTKKLKITMPVKIIFIISLSVNIFENFDFVQKFQRTLNIVNIFEKSRCWEKFP